jgi:DNA gyrase subunit A
MQNLTKRTAYFKMRRALTGEDAGEADADAIDLSTERYEELAALEQWILTVTAGGFGKRSSAHEYRVSGRGGLGVAAANLSRREDKIVAAFTVDEDDQIMLATSTGQSIRCPVSGISRQGRTSSGVTVFNTKDGEHVVSVAYIAETEDDEAEETSEE